MTIMMESAMKVVWFVAKMIFYYGNLSLLVSIMAMLQERKVWKATSTPMSIWGLFKCYMLNVCWMWGCLLLLLVLLPTWMVRIWFDRDCIRRESHSVIEYGISTFLISVFVGEIKVDHPENLPPVPAKGTVAPVFVANHITTIDAPSVYLAVNQSFKWIFKKSILLLPGVGPVMRLSDHIMIDRRTGKNTSSVNNLYTQSNNAIQSGTAMFVFPQGTRKYAERLPFKDGAFRIAITNEAPIVPISIDVPLNTWNTAYPINLLWGGKGTTVTLTIHKPIPTNQTTDKEDLKQKVSDLIYSVLPPVPLAQIKPRTTTKKEEDHTKKES